MKEIFRVYIVSKRQQVLTYLTYSWSKTEATPQNWAGWRHVILQGSVVTQTVLGGLTIRPQLQISNSVYVPKIIMKVGYHLSVDKDI